MYCKEQRKWHQGLVICMLGDGEAVFCFCGPRHITLRHRDPATPIFIMSFSTHNARQASKGSTIKSDHFPNKSHAT